MSRSETTGGYPQLVRLNAVVTSKLDALDGNIRRIHPERMSEHDWRDMRVSFLEMIAAWRELHQATMDLLDTMEANREPSNSGCDSPPSIRTN